jgi:hypothetical protein
VQETVERTPQILGFQIFLTYANITYLSVALTPGTPDIEYCDYCDSSVSHPSTQVACRDREHPMTMRTSRRKVTFRRPFSLRGMDAAQPAGTYTVETNEELLEGLSVPAWRRTATVILLRPQAGAAGPCEELEIDPLELEAAQESDAVIQPGIVVEATIDELLADAVLQQAVHSAGLTLAEFRTLLRDLAARILAARIRRASADRPMSGS